MLSSTSAEWHVCLIICDCTSVSTLLYQTCQPTETNAIITFSGFKFCFCRSIFTFNLLHIGKFLAGWSLFRHENDPCVSFSNFMRLCAHGIYCIIKYLNRLWLWRKASRYRFLGYRIAKRVIALSYGDIALSCGVIALHPKTILLLELESYRTGII